MTRLIKIGSLMGIRTPKPIVEQAELADKTLEFEVVEQGLLIKTVRSPRSGWEADARRMSAEGDDEPLIPDTLANDFDQSKWRW
jgi:antitoxin MazE